MKNHLALLLTVVSITTACAEDKKPATSDKAMPTPEVVLPESEWKKKLTPEQYAVTREAATERPNGETYHAFEKQGEGTYYCVCCGAELFTSKEKFHSGCGWPSFYDASKAKGVAEHRDPDGSRIETVCKRCNAHLGHVFEGEGFKTPTDRRFCINGIALNFVPAGGAAPKLLELGTATVDKKKEEVAKEAGVEVKKP